MEASASATRAWLVYRAGFGFALYLGVATFTLNLIDRVGAGPVALVLTGTTLEVCYTVAEVPTGVVADRYGRKPSVLIGLVVVGVAFVLDAVPVLGVVVAAQVFMGVGWTFMSGADVAWLTDEVGEDAARPLYASGARAELWGSVAGIVAGAGLGQLALWVPLVAAGLAMAVLAAWLSAGMEESGRAAPPGERALGPWSSGRHASRTAMGSGGAAPEVNRRAAHEDRLTVAETVRRTRASVRARPAVGVLLAVMVAAGLGGEGVDRLWQLHLVGDEAGEGRTVVVVAALFVGSLVLGAALTTLVERRLAADDDGAHARRWLAAGNVLVGVSVLLLAVGPWWLAAGGLVASGALRHACFPLVQAWANRGADPATRATLNSLVGQAESVGEIAGGGFGGLAAATGTGPTLAVSAAVFATGGWLATWRRSSTGEPAAGTAPLGARTAARSEG